MGHLTDGPSVSVVVPVYNGERYLAEAIESVLGQGYEPLEVLVVDDGSSDRSAEVAERFAGRVCLIRAPHGGAASAAQPRSRGGRGRLPGVP